MSHQNQSSEVNTNNELCETSCLPNRVCQSQGPTPMTISNYYHDQIQQETINSQ